MPPVSDLDPSDAKFNSYLDIKMIHVNSTGIGTQQTDWKLHRTTKLEGHISPLLWHVQPICMIGKSYRTIFSEFPVRPKYYVVGFDKADVDKLFVPFQCLSGTNDYKGFGNGPATVERIVQRHGGRIWAERGPGKGACF
jgi:hypothetical protein